MSSRGIERRVDNRQGFLASAIVHSLILTVLSSHPDALDSRADDEASTARKTSRVFMPPPAVVKQMLPAPAAPPAPPRPRPTPPPQGKDRVSVGAPSKFRQKRLVLNRDDDLTKVAKGKPDAASGPSGTPAAVPTPQTPRAEQTRAASSSRAGGSGLRLPPGYGPDRSGDGRPARRSIAESLKNLDDVLPPSAPGGFGAATGTVKQMGPLSFDPQGADFTVWINHFKNEVYRNWNVPHVAIMFSGHVDLQFTVLRNGKMIDLEMLKSSGVRGLDNAARGALLGSLFLELPADYSPDRVTIQVSFHYGGGPRSS